VITVDNTHKGLSLEVGPKLLNFFFRNIV
jgi:hypothetical protein